VLFIKGNKGLTYLVELVKLPRWWAQVTGLIPGAMAMRVLGQLGDNTRQSGWETSCHWMRQGWCIARAQYCFVIALGWVIEGEYWQMGKTCQMEQ